MKLVTSNYVAFLLFIISSLFVGGAIGNDNVLIGLNAVRLTVNVPENANSLDYTIQNSIETKLRQSGLKVKADSNNELRVNVTWVELDPSRKQIDGKYGTVQLTVNEQVKLLREPSVSVYSSTWEGVIWYGHGPSGSFANITKQAALDLTDEFINSWWKVNLK